jgi:hypothetical protein
MDSAGLVCGLTILEAPAGMLYHPASVAEHRSRKIWMLNRVRDAMANLQIHQCIHQTRCYSENLIPPKSRLFGSLLGRQRRHKAGVDVLEQLQGFWNILGTKPSVHMPIFSNFQA